MTMTNASVAGGRREAEIDRRDTGIRIALTVLFAIVASLLRSILGVVVVFGLAWSLVTRRPPSEGLRNAANRLISFHYRIARWLTYNAGEIPFPFSDFPDAVEASDWDPEVGEAEILGCDLGGDHRDEEDGDLR
jgi:hypothetical protein